MVELAGVHLEKAEFHGQNTKHVSSKEPGCFKRVYILNFPLPAILQYPSLKSYLWVITVKCNLRKIFMLTCLFLLWFFESTSTSSKELHMVWGKHWKMNLRNFQERMEVKTSRGNIFSKITEVLKCGTCSETWRIYLREYWERSAKKA